MNFRKERNIRLNIFRIMVDIIWINKYVYTAIVRSKIGYSTIIYESANKFIFRKLEFTHNSVLAIITRTLKISFTSLFYLLH